ncbi:MAG TPA: VWA domain-containing protein [Terriglobales bacterium]
MSYTLRSRMMLAVVVSLMPMLSSRAGAQQSSDVPTITMRANTRMVVVDVVVKDKKGQPVTGLKAEDFAVDENGKKQKIATFTPPGADQAAPLPMPPGIMTNKPEYLKPAGVPTVLLLDAANSHFLDQAYGRTQMLKYAVQQSIAASPMAVMTLTNRLEVLQDFTTDPRVLLAAIKKVQPQEPLLLNATLPADAAILAGQLATSQLLVENFQSQFVGYVLERRTEATIEALRELARVLGGFPGRKNVVWLTADFPFALIPEDTNMSDAELLADLPSKARVSNNVIVNGGGNALADLRGRYNEPIRQAQAAVASAGIAVYPVDMRGLMARGIDVNVTSSLEELASQTGGKAYVNQNEIMNGIALAVSDEKASYSIGYYPENKKWDGKFRAIKVKLSQGDREVRYRKGYFAYDPALVKNPHFESDVAATLQLNASATQVIFMAQAKPAGPQKTTVVFLVDAHTISVEDAGNNKRLNVALYAELFDAKGKSIGSRSSKVDRAFDAATYQQILDKGMMVPLDVEVPAGAKELRLAVLDNKTGYIGTVSGPIGQ